MSERARSSVGEVGDGGAGSASGLPPQVTPYFELLLDADPGVLASLRQRCVDWLEKLRWPEAPIVDAVIALDAAVSNSVQHAYRDPGGCISVHALAASRCRRTSAARFTVRDWGRWRIRNSSPPGTGFVLMADLSDDLFIETGPEGTVVILTTPVVALS